MWNGNDATPLMNWKRRLLMWRAGLAISGGRPGCERLKGERKAFLARSGKTWLASKTNRYNYSAD
jgi:hypothetical protein